MNNIGKNIKIEMDKQFANELGKTLNTGSENIGEFLQNAQSFRNAVTSEDIDKDIIPNKKIKKSDIIKNLSKTKKSKSETKEATSAGSAGGYSAPLFTIKKKDITEKGEFKEATSSASSGSYETPAAWAKSTGKKDWRGKSKTQIPGGQFVTVKKKCKTFPYCNQGDINALKFTNEEIMNKSIKKLSKNYNISEEFIKKLIIADYLKIK